MTTRADAAGTTTYSYDSAGRLATATNTTSGVAVTYDYNDLSQVDRITYGTGGNARWLTYDPLHRLTADELKDPAGTTTIAKITYSWDENDNLTGKTTTGFAGSAVNTYGYDHANRLTSWYDGVTPTVYAYDKSGNRVQAGTRLFTYDERNQLKTQTGVADVTYSYTPRGTLSAVSTLGVGTLYTRADAFGQVLTQHTTPTQSTSYAYDALGRLVRPGASFTGTGNTLAGDSAGDYTRGPDGGLLGAKSGTSQRLMWTDLHTDVVGQFDATGTVLAGSTTYDPLGKVLTTTGMIGDLGYQSEYTDLATGRVNMHARWYNTDTGQFDVRDSIGVDPVPTSVRANRFAYADDSPLVNTDPTGHCSFCSWVSNKVSSGWNKATSAVSNAWNKATTAASNAWNRATSAIGNAYANAYRSAYSWANQRLDDAKRWAKQQAEKVRNVVDQGRKWVNDKIERGKKWVNDQVQRGKKWVNDQVDKAKQKIKQALDAAKQAGKRIAANATRVARQAYNNVKDAYKAASTWVAEHKDLLIDIAAVGVGILGAVACTAATAGAGAVACMVGAAALVNLAKDAAKGDIHNFGDAFGSLGTGAVQGALGGIGGAIGGRIAGAVAGRLGAGIAAGLGGRMFSGGLAGGLGDAATQVLNGDSVNWGSVALSTGIGAVFGGFYRGKGCHSFAPGTRVLMADGTTRPIKDVNIGDKVKATDPTTGKTEAKPVTALHLNRDRDLARVTVRAGAKSRASKIGAAAAAVAVGTATLATTQNHPFWDQSTRTWVNAADLRPGRSILRTPDRATVSIAAVTNYTGDRLMRDVTVADLHTYYVIAGDTSVLVHNCKGGVDADGKSCSCTRGDPVKERRPFDGDQKTQDGIDDLANAARSTGDMIDIAVGMPDGLTPSGNGGNPPAPGRPKTQASVGVPDDTPSMVAPEGQQASAGDVLETLAMIGRIAYDAWKHRKRG